VKVFPTGRNLLLIALLLIAVATLAAIRAPKQDSQKHQDAAQPTFSAEELTARIDRTVAKDSAIIGIYAEDLQTGTSYSYKGRTSWESGSTQKLQLLAYLYHQASANQINLSQEIPVTPADIQDYGSGSLRYGLKKPAYTYRELAALVAKESDNTAARVLNNQLDDHAVQAFGAEQGMTSTDFAANRSTPADLVTLWKAIYRDQIANPALSAELRQSLTATTNEDRLPANLPPGTTVIHKTGDALDGGLHDTGVIESGGHAYAITLFTHDVEPEKLPKISRHVFDYFLGG